MEPNSKLTRSRPDIWERALLLSTKLTAYQYVPKIPDEQTGTIYACGGSWSNYYPERRDPPLPVPPKTPEEIKQEKIERIDGDIEDKEEEIERKQQEIDDRNKWINGYKEEIKERKREKGELEDELDELKRERKLLLAAPRLFVPEGAMEWLLHEVGHWVAASDEERLLPDYGFGTLRDGECKCTSNFTECRCGDNREWEAWAFEEIVLAPFGNSRQFCPPPHRGGIAFHGNQPIPGDALRHIEARLRADAICVEQWRQVWGEWVQWGVSLGLKAPWSWESCEQSAIRVDK